MTGGGTLYYVWVLESSFSLVSFCLLLSFMAAGY